MNRTFSALLILGLSTAYGSGQSQPPVRTSTEGVLIDVTVLDNKGQPVLDLTPADFELREDGKQQQIVSVTLVRAGVARVAGSSPGARQAVPLTTVPASDLSALEQAPTVTALLFDRLSPEATPHAVRAAMTYVSTLAPPNDYAGVFVADLNLRTLEPFTNDQASLRRAIEQFGATATANLRPEAQRAGDGFARGMDPHTPPTAGAEEPGGSTTVAEREQRLKDMEASKDYARYFMTKMVLRMESGFRQFLAEYEGHSSTAGLRATVDGLALLPGRKSILYFTENLPITDRLKAKFEALIGQANRANITLYTVDAAGLRLHSKEAELARDVSLAGAQGIGDARRDDGAWTKELERQEQLMVSRPAAVLGRLAKDTGGFLIENTNDLAAGVQRMQQERTTYYLLGYQPTNEKMDGKFRRVSVKVKRSKVTVRARPGYLAVPAPTR